MRLLDAIGRDARHALRWLWRSPGFAAVALLSLALGIGFNTAIFAVADALLLRPLPVTAPDRLVDLYTSGADGDTYSTNSVPDLGDYRAQVDAFADLAGYSPMFGAVSVGDRARLTLGEVVTGNYFQLLGVTARLGRTLEPADDAPGADRVAVLSTRYWQSQLGGQPDVLSRTLRIKGQVYAIVGVLPDAFTGMVPILAPEIWIATRHVDDVEPAGINEVVPSPTGTTRLDRRGQRWLFAKARLKSGASLDQARAGVGVVAARLAEAYPQTNRERRVVVRPTSATRVHPEADGLMAWVVGGTMLAVALVLVVACANVAGMLLARASSRQREISIRLAIGASRRRLIQQLLTEGAVLGVLGAIGGVIFATWMMGALTRVDLPLKVALALDLRLDARVLGFSVVVAIAAGLLAALAPALQASRTNLVRDLRGEAPGTGGRRRWNGRDALVVSQIAITALLLVMAGLLVKSLSSAQSADVGFATRGLAVVSADTDMLAYSPDRSRLFWEEASRRIGALPGVQGVATASRLPFSLNFSRDNIAVPGVQQRADQMGESTLSAVVSARYFETLGVGVLRGREFAQSDTPDRRPVAIVNDAFARQYWPGGDAIGRQVFERTLDSGRPLEIVGVVADHKMQTVGEPALPAIYLAAPQRPNGYQVLMARTTGDEHALLADMRKILLDIDGDVVVMESQTMREQMSAMLLPVRAGAWLVSLFSAFALLLSAMGLYGVMAFAVARRTRELGIRMAIGARPRGVLALVLKQGFARCGIGLVAGFGLAALATRAVASSLYGVSGADPLVWVSVAGILLVVTLFANLLPARRAMRIDPVRALRAD